MAEIVSSQVSGARSGRKKLSTRVDLTPMVDLGFLLITFFMYTTTLARPKAMELRMPDKGHLKDTTAFIAESTITIMPVRDHKVIFYNGELKQLQNLACSGFQPDNSIREVLMKKQKEVAVLPASFSRDAHYLHVIIKPGSDCTYDDVVRLLDEMSILDVQYYALMDITPEETEWVKKFAAGAYGKF